MAIMLSKTGDSMSGALSLPANGLTVGTNQLVVSGGKVGINTTAIHEALTIGGNGSAIELGSDVVGKEIDAGKIGYQKFTVDALDIVGAGTNNFNRKIKFWNEAGANFTGPVGLPTNGLVVGTNQLVVSGGKVGINTTALHEALTIGGNTSTIELGSDVVGKEPQAGKIGYQRFTADALDIVGAGTTSNNRKIKFWNEAGANFTGPVYVAGKSSSTISSIC